MMPKGRPTVLGWYAFLAWNVVLFHGLAAIHSPVLARPLAVAGSLLLATSFLVQIVLMMRTHAASVRTSQGRTVINRRTGEVVPGNGGTDRTRRPGAVAQVARLTKRRESRGDPRDSIGRLVRDPEVRTVRSGQTMARFALAVDQGLVNMEGHREVDFIDVVAWRALAERVGQHLRRGRLVGIEGRLQIRRFETARGKRRKAAEVVADRVRFLDRKPSEVKPDEETFVDDEALPEEVEAGGPF